MGRRLKKLKKIRLHREGTHTLLFSGMELLLLNAVLFYGIENKIPFYVVFCNQHYTVSDCSKLLPLPNPCF